MTITDSFLENVAKAMAGVSYDYPTYNLVATGINTTIDTDATALTGEVGTRGAYTISQSVNEVTYNFIRSGTSVLDTTNGDDLTAVGGDIGSTSSDLQFAIPITETQTTSFDLEFEFVLTVNR